MIDGGLGVEALMGKLDVDSAKRQEMNIAYQIDQAKVSHLSSVNTNTLPMYRSTPTGPDPLQTRKSTPLPKVGVGKTCPTPRGIATEKWKGVLHTHIS